MRTLDGPHFTVHTQRMVRTCSIARSLQVVGERWSLLVVREVALGVRRFSDIQSATGAPPAVLADRLKCLVANGILETRPYQEPGTRTRTEYALTPAGHELQPVLAALKDWGDSHLADENGPPVVTRHRDCGAAVHARLVCEAGHVVEGTQQLRAESAALRISGNGPFLHPRSRHRS
jgi:DNA-binding HxlR family transcriptional regulator